MNKDFLTRHLLRALRVFVVESKLLSHHARACRSPQIGDAPKMPRLFICLALLSVLSFAAEDRLVVDDEAFEREASAAAALLHKAGKLVPLKELRAQPRRPHCELALPEPRKDALRPQEINRLVRGSTVAVAEFFKCSKCKDWHFESSSGFVAAAGVVSTCLHVVDVKDEEPKQNYLVVADARGRVFPVTEVLAASAVSDTCLLRVPGLDLPPLPLGRNAQVGDPVFCLSHPDGNHWMFTSGMVSRYFISREEAAETGRKGKPKKPETALYLNITAEFSPGSSGAPVVDECGNVIGQVEAITTSIEEEKDEKGKSVATSYGMPVRSCISSEEIAKLVRPPAKSGK